MWLDRLVIILSTMMHVRTYTHTQISTPLCNILPGWSEHGAQTQSMSTYIEYMCLCFSTWLWFERVCVCAYTCWWYRYYQQTRALAMTPSNRGRKKKKKKPRKLKTKSIALREIPRDRECITYCVLIIIIHHTRVDRSKTCVVFFYPSVRASQLKAIRNVRNENV